MMRFSGVKLNDINEETSNSTKNEELDVRAKKEIDKFPGNNNNASSSSSSRLNRNPRIVRVSRNFGGKDRHSKVCTVRGLRDRRIRLSVPTAIQLYDLQDRLGLSQPSKVIDWLLDIAKNDIDKLPPLPPIPGLIHDQDNTNTTTTTNNNNNNNNNYQEGFGVQNFFPLMSNNQFFPMVPNFSPYNNLFNNNNWDPSNLSLSQFGFVNSNIPLPTSQMYPCPPANVLPSIFPPFSSYNASANLEGDHLKQFNFMRDN